MKIIINGQPKDFDAPPNLYGILENEGMSGMMVALAHNGAFIPKSDYGKITLKDDDEIEIVAPMQGG